MTSQTENSTVCAKEWIPYRQPYVQAIGQKEDYETLFHRNDMILHGDSAYAQHMQVHNQIQEQLRILRTSIDAVERIHDREINILYRLIEERTLILSDVDEIYNDYC